MGSRRADASFITMGGSSFSTSRSPPSDGTSASRPHWNRPHRPSSISSGNRRHRRESDPVNVAQPARTDAIAAGQALVTSRPGYAAARPVTRSMWEGTTHRGDTRTDAVRHLRTPRQTRRRLGYMPRNEPQPAGLRAHPEQGLSHGRGEQFRVGLLRRTSRRAPPSTDLQHPLRASAAPRPLGLTRRESVPTTLHRLL